MALSTYLSALLAFFAYPYISKIFMSFLMKKFTLVNELLDVNKARIGCRKIEGTVVVAGGGGGGLITACILRKHFTKVIVIEPEAWVNTEEGCVYDKPSVHNVDGLRTPFRKRRRVPQFLALHTWPSFVLATMRQLFPRWDHHIKSERGIIEPFLFNAVYSGIPMPVPQELYPLGMPDTMFISRSLFEPMLRRNVKTVYPEIEFITGSVTGINPDNLDKSKISSVSYHLNNEEDISTQDVMLFIDCAGPINAGIKWLGNAGYGHDSEKKGSINGTLPLERLTIKYNQKMRASTSYWPLTSALQTGIGVPRGGFIYAYFPCPGRDDRMLGIGRLEDDQILILCSGWGDHVPVPRNLDEFREYIEGLNPFIPVPEWVFKLLDDLREYEGKAVYDIYTLPPCSRVQYTKATNLPSNFIAIGDSTMAVNPVFGQGFTKVCMGALILDSMLQKLSSDIASLPTNFSTEFFTNQDAKVNEPIWQQTKTQDYAWPTTIPVPGESLAEGRFMRWYGHNLLFASLRDEDLTAIRWRVTAYIYPGILLLSPRAWIKVLQQWWSGTIPGVSSSSK